MGSRAQLPPDNPQIKYGLIVESGNEKQDDKHRGVQRLCLLADCDAIEGIEQIHDQRAATADIGVPCR
jgi:hypothetical protein